MMYAKLHRLMSTKDFLFNEMLPLTYGYHLAFVHEDYLFAGFRVHVLCDEKFPIVCYV